MLNSIHIYQFIRFGSNLFVFWVFSRVFSIGQVGIIEKSVLLANLCTFFWLQAIQTHFLKKNAYSYHHYASLILILSVSIGLTILMYSLWNSLYFFSGLYVLFYPFGTLLEMYWIAEQNSKKLIKYSILFYGIWTISITLTAYFFRSMQMVYCVWIGILCLRAVFFAVYTSFKHVKLNYVFLKSLLWLTLTFLVTGSTEYIDIFLVDFIFGKEALAQFRYGAKEIPIFLILANSMSLWTTQNTTNATSENFTKVLSHVKRKSAQYLIMGTGVSILLMLISTVVFRYVYGKEYLPSSVILDIMLLLVLSRFIFSNSILLGLGLDKVQFVITCIEVGLNLVLSLIGAHFWGMYGIAAATVVAYLMEKMLLAAYLYVKKRISPFAYIPVFLVIVCYAGLFCTLVIKYRLGLFFG